MLHVAERSKIGSEDTMKLQKITIKNFRSIEEQSLEIKEIGGSYTYALIGVNESGKSSFLEATALFEGGAPDFPDDFHDETKPVEVIFHYELETVDKDELRDDLISKGFDDKAVAKASVKEVDIRIFFSPIANTQRQKEDIPVLEKEVWPDYTLQGTAAIKKEKGVEVADFNLREYFATFLPEHFWQYSHRAVFWRSEDRYLISTPVDLDVFATQKEKLSVPLANCFQLAGITDIPGAIQKMKTSPADSRNLQDKLSDKVTDHIKKVWPNHPIRIKFQINGTQLTFLVEDEGVKYKVKTTSQRSDGFRQLISFLLTISAQNSAAKLSNTLLLLDEPETHLHPQAQEYLKDELIRISKGKDDNIVIYATHSNYMIDKSHIDRCFRVIKGKDCKTEIKQFEGETSTYSEVNYEVFDIVSADYHNELYGTVEEVDKSKLDALPKKYDWKNKKTGNIEKVSLPTYIRHSIHHPENVNNKDFTQTQLKESTVTLRKLKAGLSKS